LAVLRLEGTSSDCGKQIIVVIWHCPHRRFDALG
jgi:hypothetical protein